MRVIAGSAKGRPLVAPRGLHVRPTTDKAKGAIFSMLAALGFRRAELSGMSAAFPFPRVLDLFAGSGALGIEALSRGAETVDFVERDLGALAAIRRNLEHTGFVGRGRVHQMRVESALSTFQATYDLILLDPPYSDPGVPALLEAIGTSSLLGMDTVAICEHARTIEVPAAAGRLRLQRTRLHGTTAISLFEVAPHDSDYGT